MADKTLLIYDVAAVDVGNTRLTVGYYLNGSLVKIKHRKTKYIKNSIKIINSNKIIVSSVVPKISKLIIKKYPQAHIVNKKDLAIGGLLDNIGLDRSINLFMALKLYGKNIIVVDFGTATTISVIANNIFQGGLIMPGISLMLNGLGQAAQLPKVDKLTNNSGLLQFETERAIISGVQQLTLKGLAGILDGLKKDLGVDCLVIATGGFSISKAMKIEEVDVINPTLLLEGLFYLAN